MKISFLLIGFFISSISFSQTFSEILLNPVYDNLSSHGYSVHLNDDTLTVFGKIVVPTGVTHTQIGQIMIKYDTSGVAHDYQTYQAEDSLLFLSHGLYSGTDELIINDSLTFTTVSREYLSYADSIIENRNIQRLDRNGEIISRHEINWPEPADFIMSGVKSLSANEHLVYGHMWHEGGIAALQNNGYLLNCNSLGEVNWVQQYDSVALVFFMDRNAAGENLITGAIRNPPGNNVSDHVVFKTDADGNEMWKYFYGSPGSEAYSANVFTHDGHVMSISIINAGITFARGPIRLQKIQDNGTSYEVVDEVLHDEDNAVYREYRVNGLKQVSDNNYVSYGSGFLPYDETLPDVPERAFVFKFDNNLDSLWARWYGVWNTEINSENFFFDMVEGPDSCLYLTGAAERGFGDLYGLSHLWVVKLDKHGCLEPGCHLIEEDSANHVTQIIGLQNSLKVFPNPVRDRFTLEINLPPEFSPPSGSVLKLLDINGREVKQIKLNNMSQSHTEKIDVSDIPAGTYTLHWMNTGLWYDSVKVVVE